MLEAFHSPGQGGWMIPPGAGARGPLTSDCPYLECEGPRIASAADRAGFSSSPELAMRVLTAIPVHNEEAHLEPVLDEVLRFADDVLVVDDGSTDRTPELLRGFP